MTRYCPVIKQRLFNIGSQHEEGVKIVEHEIDPRKFPAIEALFLHYPDLDKITLQFDTERKIEYIRVE